MFRRFIQSLRSSRHLCVWRALRKCIPILPRTHEPCVPTLYCSTRNTGWDVERTLVNQKSPKQRLTIYSGPLIFLLRLGIINAGHFDKLSDRIASALAAQETRQAQGPNRVASPPHQQKKHPHGCFFDESTNRSYSNRILNVWSSRLAKSEKAELTYRKWAFWGQA